MIRALRALPLLSLVIGCGGATVSGSRMVMVKSTGCHEQRDERVAMTYVGFHGKGAPPPALGQAILARIPDARIVVIEDGHLAIVTALGMGPGAPASDTLGSLRDRQNAAAATVGWVGDEIDFPMVASDCGMTFLTPVPLPAPTMPPPTK